MNECYHIHNTYYNSIACKQTLLKHQHIIETEDNPEHIKLWEEFKDPPEKNLKNNALLHQNYITQYGSNLGFNIPLIIHKYNSTARSYNITNILDQEIELPFHLVPEQPKRIFHSVMNTTGKALPVYINWRPTLYCDRDLEINGVCTLNSVPLEIVHSHYYLGVLLHESAPSCITSAHFTCRRFVKKLNTKWNAFTNLNFSYKQLGTATKILILKTFLLCYYEIYAQILPIQDTHMNKITRAWESHITNNLNCDANIVNVQLLSGILPPKERWQLLKIKFLSYGKQRRKYSQLDNININAKFKKQYFTKLAADKPRSSCFSVMNYKPSMGNNFFLPSLCQLDKSISHSKLENYIKVILEVQLTDKRKRKCTYCKCNKLFHTNFAYIQHCTSECNSYQMNNIRTKFWAYQKQQLLALNNTDFSHSAEYAEKAMDILDKPQKYKKQLTQLVLGCDLVDKKEELYKSNKKFFRKFDIIKNEFVELNNDNCMFLNIMCSSIKWVDLLIHNTSSDQYQTIIDKFPEPDSSHILYNSITKSKKDAQVFIRRHIKPNDWQLWGDGSEDKDTLNGGCGGCIRGNKGSLQWFKALGCQENNYAELNAIYTNLSILDQILNIHPELANNRVIVFTDSMNAYNWITKYNSKCAYSKLLSQTKALVNKLNAVLVKVKSHCEIDGNETADKLAGRGKVYSNLTVSPDYNLTYKAKAFLSCNYTFRGKTELLKVLATEFALRTDNILRKK
jgi:ribonuclease HI